MEKSHSGGSCVLSQLGTVGLGDSWAVGLVTGRTKLVNKCESFFGGRDVSWEKEKGHDHLFHLQQSKKAFNGNNYPGTKATG